MNNVHNRAFQLSPFALPPKIQNNFSIPAFAANQATSKGNLTADSFTLSGKSQLQVNNSKILFGRASLKPVTELRNTRSTPVTTALIDIDNTIVTADQATAFANGKPKEEVVGKAIKEKILTRNGFLGIQNTFQVLRLNHGPNGESVITTARPGHEAVQIAQGLGIEPELGNSQFPGSYHMITDQGASVIEVDRGDHSITPVRKFPIPSDVVSNIEQTVQQFNSEQGIAGTRQEIRLIAYHADGTAETTSNVPGSPTKKPFSTEIPCVTHLSPDPTKIVLYLQAEKDYGVHDDHEKRLLTDITKTIQDELGEQATYAPSSKGYLEIYSAETSKANAALAYADHMEKEHGMNINLEEGLGIGDQPADAEMARVVDLIMMGDSPDHAMDKAAEIARSHKHTAYEAAPLVISAGNKQLITANSGFAQTGREIKKLATFVGFPRPTGTVPDDTGNGEPDFVEGPHKITYHYLDKK